MNNLYTKHAVLTEETLMWIERFGFEKRQLSESCYTLRDLADVAISHHITHLWVQNVGYPESTSEGDYSIKIQHRNHHMAGATLWKRGHGKPVSIIFPSYTAWYGTPQRPGWLAQALCPEEILITLRYLESALNVTVGMSPGRVGWNYLKKIHPEWIEEIPGVNLKECHFTSAAAPDIIWQRPMQSSKRYLHKFDKNAAYPYAATKTDIGVGTPIYMPIHLAGTPANHYKGHPQAVGVWRCTVIDGPFDLGLMPLPWNKKEGWLVGPMIRLLRKAGYTVEIHEGWVFPERHDVMSRWGNDLWAIRQEFDVPGHYKAAHCAQLAKAATKLIMNATIGLTAFRGYDEEDEMARPDIRCQIIATHRELTWHNIDKIRQLYGVTPLIVYMDALYYLADEEDGCQAFPELVKRSDKMGGYKYEGRIEMTADVVEMFARKMSEGERLEFLNKKGWRKE